MRRMQDSCNADLSEMMHIYVTEEEVAYTRCRHNVLISLAAWLPKRFRDNNCQPISPS